MLVLCNDIVERHFWESINISISSHWAEYKSGESRNNSVLQAFDVSFRDFEIGTK